MTRSFFFNIKIDTYREDSVDSFPFSSHTVLSVSFSAGWADASPLRGQERARAGGRNPARQRSAFPVQDQGSYWSKQPATKPVVYSDIIKEEEKEKITWKKKTKWSIQLIT